MNEVEEFEAGAKRLKELTREAIQKIIGAIPIIRCESCFYRRNFFGGKFICKKHLRLVRADDFCSKGMLK